MLFLLDGKSCLMVSHVIPGGYSSLMVSHVIPGGYSSLMVSHIIPVDYSCLMVSHSCFSHFISNVLEKLSSLLQILRTGQESSRL